VRFSFCIFSFSYKQTDSTDKEFPWRVGVGYEGYITVVAIQRWG